jgi:NAD(P)-dependent dehydrogenase (short-subunit alcohol dehydrogenase family)
MTLGYAKTLAPRLRVNGILVGPALINPRQSQKHFENMLKGTKLGCGTSPTEIAKTVRFLVETPSITGALIPLDGNHALA